MEYTIVDLQQHVSNYVLSRDERNKVAEIVLDTKKLKSFTRLTKSRYLELRLKVAETIHMHYDLPRTYPTKEQLTALDLLILVPHLYLKEGQKVKGVAHSLSIRSIATARAHIQVGVLILHKTYNPINRPLTPQDLLRLERGFSEAYQTQSICWRADYAFLHLLLYGVYQKMLLVCDANHLILYGELHPGNETTGEDEDAFRNSLFFEVEIEAKLGQMVGIMCRRPFHSHEIPLSGCLDGSMGWLYDDFKICLEPLPKIRRANRQFIGALENEWNKATESVRRCIELRNNQDLKMNYGYLERKIYRSEFHKVCFKVVCQMSNSLREADGFYKSSPSGPILMEMKKRIRKL